MQQATYDTSVATCFLKGGDGGGQERSTRSFVNGRHRHHRSSLLGEQPPQPVQVVIGGRYAHPHAHDGALRVRRVVSHVELLWGKRAWCGMVTESRRQAHVQNEFCLLFTQPTTAAATAVC